MRKILCLLLSFTLVLSLCSCVSNKADDPTKNTNPTRSSSSALTETDELGTLHDETDESKDDGNMDMKWEELELPTMPDIITTAVDVGDNSQRTIATTPFGNEEELVEKIRNNEQLKSMYNSCSVDRIEDNHYEKDEEVPYTQLQTSITFYNDDPTDSSQIKFTLTRNHNYCDNVESVSVMIYDLNKVNSKHQDVAADALNEILGNVGQFVARGKDPDSLDTLGKKISEYNLAEKIDVNDGYSYYTKRTCEVDFEKVTMSVWVNCPFDSTSANRQYDSAYHDLDYKLNDCFEGIQKPEFSNKHEFLIDVADKFVPGTAFPISSFSVSEYGEKNIHFSIGTAAQDDKERYLEVALGYRYTKDEKSLSNPKLLLSISYEYDEKNPVDEQEARQLVLDVLRYIKPGIEITEIGPHKLKEERIEYDVKYNIFGFEQTGDMHITKSDSNVILQIYD